MDSGVEQDRGNEEPEIMPSGCVYVKRENSACININRANQGRRSRGADFNRIQTGIHILEYALVECGSTHTFTVCMQSQVSLHITLAHAHITVISPQSLSSQIKSNFIYPRSRICLKGFTVCTPSVLKHSKQIREKSL